MNRPLHPSPFPPKRPLPTEPKSFGSGLTGTRFAKYGPLDDEPPLKSAKASTSRLARSPLHHPVKTSHSSEPIRPRPKVAAGGGKLDMSHRGSAQSIPDRPRPLGPPVSRIPLRPTKEIGRPRPISPPAFRRPASGPRQKPFDPRVDVIDEEYAKKNISSIIGSMFGYDRTKYRALWSMLTF